MSEPQTIICVACPKGCATQIIELDGALKVLGRVCKQGRVYVRQEYRDPRRMLTTTVKVAHGPVRRIAVRSAAAIPKQAVRPGMATLAAVRVTPPIRMGDVILHNIAAGVDVVAAEDLNG